TPRSWSSSSSSAAATVVRSRRRSPARSSTPSSSKRSPASSSADSQSMVGIDRRLLQNVDWPLLGATVGLVILSASTLASLQVGRAGGGIAIRQISWFGVGLAALVVMASIDYRRLVRAAPLLYVLGLLALVAVFVLGRTVSGARRWLMVGPVSVQPSE